MPIGWTPKSHGGKLLRAFAYVDPQAVKKYVAANEDRLSGLSKREALKKVA